MRCPGCGHEIRQAAKFCEECGVNLQPSELDSQTRSRRTTTAPRPAPARKYVTALFSDLTGYTALTERLDPEQVKELTGRIFTGVKDIVTRYEGFIERVMGDGVLAFFGIPQSHEDDPIRAVHTAIEIHHLLIALSPHYEPWTGTPLSMHSGINTGLVVTADANPEKGAHGIHGDAVNVASRLSSLAGPGEILVGEETVRRTRGRFVFQDLGARQVKGKADPIAVFKVIDAKSPTRAFGADRKVSSEMVGRDKELDRLELQVMKAVNGEGSVVNVVGEAGIGKSRLIVELRRREVMKRVLVLEGRSMSMGKNLSFHPINDLMKQWAGIAEDDSESAGFDKLERAIRAIHPDKINDILPFLATLMGMKLKGRHAERIKGIEGEALEKFIFKNVRDLIVKGSEMRPTVLVMEDLHWADESSLGLLESLFQLVEKSRLLFINVFRPGYWPGEKRPVERIGALLPDRHIEIALQPLDKEMSDALIGNMLNIKGLPYSLRMEISERAGGNPFFIEEVLRSLIDQGAIVPGKGGEFEITERINLVVVPHTINDVLMARIDRLEERTRELVKCASVIGRSFFDRILKDVAASVEDIDSKLNCLKDLQLIRDRVRMDELEYLFKHALAQEVAYESTLLQQRKEIHLKVAQSIEKLFKERLHEFYGMLAYHYSKAEDPEKAEEWMVKAGEEALRTSASSEALQYYKEALRLYLEKYGEAADPEKLADFEKNIALAHHNKAQHASAVHHFDRVFSLWGRRAPENRMAIMAKLAYDLSVIALRLYLPSMTRKKIPDQRVNEYFDLSLKKDVSLIATFPKRWVAETIGDLREIYKYDLSRLNIASASQSGASSLLALIGFRRMSERVLLGAQQFLDPQNVHGVTVHGAITSYVRFNYGRWNEIPEYDASLFHAALRNGVFSWAAVYVLFQGYVRTYRGRFSEANELVEALNFLKEEYQYNSPIRHMLPTALMVASRRLGQACLEANYMISNSAERESRATELEGNGWRALAQVLMKDFDGAKESLRQAEYIRDTQAFWPPQHLSSTLLAQFMLDLRMLDDAMGGDSRQLISEYAKAALKSGKQVVASSSKFAAHRVESYRLMGVHYWLLGKQRRAFKWFDRAVGEAERLGARPDLARTYMEVGRRLMEPHSKSNNHKGIGADEYIEKARSMFEEMDLQWDLEELERAHNKS